MWWILVIACFVAYYFLDSFLQKVTERARIKERNKRVELLRQERNQRLNQLWQVLKGTGFTKDEVMLRFVVALRPHLHLIRHLPPDTPNNKVCIQKLACKLFYRVHTVPINQDVVFKDIEETTGLKIYKDLLWDPDFFHDLCRIADKCEDAT